MSPLDISVLIFFVLVGIKAFTESIEFWKRQEKLALIDLRLEQLKHIDTKPAANPRQIKTVRVTRTTHRVNRIGMNHSATKPVPLRRILPAKGGTGKQMKPMKTAA